MHIDTATSGCIEGSHHARQITGIRQRRDGCVTHTWQTGAVRPSRSASWAMPWLSRVRCTDINRPKANQKKALQKGMSDLELSQKKRNAMKGKEGEQLLLNQRLGRYHASKATKVHQRQRFDSIIKKGGLYTYDAKDRKDEERGLAEGEAHCHWPLCRLRRARESFRYWNLLATPLFARAVA